LAIAIVSARASSTFFCAFSTALLAARNSGVSGSGAFGLGGVVSIFGSWLSAAQCGSVKPTYIAV
jgi:hypothetical protein